MTVSALYRPSPSDRFLAPLHTLAAALLRAWHEQAERRQQRRQAEERAAVDALIDEVHAVQRGLGHDLASVRQARWARGEGRPGQQAV